jgi:pyruvate dehydrogenase E2 component (dihydrolipoamide acetyltransferase)
MAIQITVPRLGWSMEEGTFSSWLKNDGDQVKSGDPLFALESDKVTMDVESLDSGVLHIPPDAPQPGAVVTVGQSIGFLLAEGEQVPNENAPAASAHADPLPERADAHLITPRARRVAAELHVDAAQLKGSGMGGRIRERDVRQAHAVSATSPPGAGVGHSSRIRKIVAARLEESFRTPHFYVHAEVDASFLARLREELLPIVEEQYHVRLTLNDLLVKAIAMALRARPDVNSFWNQGEIVSRSAVNIGLAVQVNDGLVVPVIRDADRLTVAEIALARHELVERCRRSEARLADLQDGSVTLSNLGPYGVDRFQAILNPPESAIVAVGRMAKRPFVDGDALVARLTMPLSISVDHRVVDGVAAAAFLKSIVDLLQSPLRLVLAR